MVRGRKTMSIDLQEARRELDIIEQLSDRPDLLLTKLFSDGSSGVNFLYQININGKYIMDFLKDCLLTIYPFGNCQIENNAYIFSLYLPALKFGKYSDFDSDDLIAKIDLNNRTYRLFTECICNYESVMAAKYDLKIIKLSDWWLRFTDLSLKNRLRQVRNVICSDRKMLVKFSDIYFWLVLTDQRKKKIQDALERESKKITYSNNYEKEKYDENIERQKYFKKFAPDHIENIKLKQGEIEEYLNDFGYVKEENL